MVDPNAIMEEAARLAEAARELDDAAAALISRTWNEEQSLRQRALALESDLRRLQSSVDSAAKKKGAVDSKIAEKVGGSVDEELYRVRCVINDGDVASLLPSKAHGRFLKMFLGPVNVRATRKEVQLKVKEEYNSYRVFFHLLFHLTQDLLLADLMLDSVPVLPLEELDLLEVIDSGAEVVNREDLGQHDHLFSFAVHKVVGAPGVGEDGDGLLLKGSFNFHCLQVGIAGYRVSRAFGRLLVLLRVLLEVLFMFRFNPQEPPLLAVMVTALGLVAVPTQASRGFVAIFCPR
ncbi:hypothetical protein BHE74_00044645 [Ensete ventricosum]|nr:hypothetical protein BHE74_00044645 [Ensete ventricosum]